MKKINNSFGHFITVEVLIVLFNYNRLQFWSMQNQHEKKKVNRPFWVIVFVQGEKNKQTFAIWVVHAESK